MVDKKNGEDKKVKNTKNLAGICLISSLFLYIVSTILDYKFPGVGFNYLIAFSEAAMVGGVADWFAVTALFKKPLNLPIPHTDLISRNKIKIGKNLSVFVRENFLSESYVRETINKFSLSEKLGDLLCSNKRYVSNLTVRVLLSAIRKLDNAELLSYLTKLAEGKLRDFNIQELTVKMLIESFKKKTHHKVLNFLLSKLSFWLSSESNKLLVIDYIKDIVKEDGGVFGSIKSYFVGDPDLKGAIDMFLFKYNHSEYGKELRGKFDGYVIDFITYIHKNPDCHKNIENIKESLLERLELEVLLKNLITEGQLMLKKDVSSPDSKVRNQIDKMLEDLILSLRTNEKVKVFIQDKALAYLPDFIIQNGQRIDEYFVNYLSKLDDRQISTLIESKVGDDLQYIRINGTVVGGLIGLSIYSFEHLLSYVLKLFF